MPSGNVQQRAACNARRTIDVDVVPSYTSWPMRCGNPDDAGIGPCCKFQPRLVGGRDPEASRVPNGLPPR
jgi:hypothetical protein